MKGNKLQITVWSTPNCSQCMMTKRQFDKLGIAYTAMDLTEHPDKAEEFKNLGYLQAPIVTTDIKIWSGFRIDKIKSLANYLFAEKE